MSKAQLCPNAARSRDRAGGGCGGGAWALFVPYELSGSPKELRASCGLASGVHPVDRLFRQ
ncbi:MAG: hypothetical protein ACOYKQ_12555, partial [Polymorphobacter sp.]